MKYIKRDGKVYGPYLYENYRVNGVTKTKYLGAGKLPRKKNYFSYFLFGAVLLGVFGLIIFSQSFFESGLTGRVTSTDSPFFSGEENVSGDNLELGTGRRELGTEIPSQIQKKDRLGHAVPSQIQKKDRLGHAVPSQIQKKNRLGHADSELGAGAGAGSSGRATVGANEVSGLSSQSEAVSVLGSEATSNSSSQPSELDNLSQELVDAGYGWLVNYTGNVSSVFYENYSCSLTGYHTVKVLTSGKHHQLFEFGWMNATAHNLATYQNMSDVFYDFEWVGNNIKFQVRSCSLANCSDASFEGPDNTSSTWFDNPNLNDLTGNVSNQRYFQYKAYLFRNDSLNQSYSSELYNVTIGAHNSTYIDKPVIKPNYYPHHRSVLNCTTTAYSPNTDVNVTFDWYNGSVFYSQENISTTSGTYAGYGLSEKSQEDYPASPNEQWSCNVSAYDGASYSENESDSVTISSVVYDYYNMQNVFYNFEWYGDNVKMQVRSCSLANCSDGDFIGSDNTSSSWFDNSDYENLSLTNLSSNRYFQYKSYLFRNVSLGQVFSPELYNVSIEDGIVLTISDDSDSATVYSNYTRFYANWTTGVESINGSGVWCTWRHNKTGSWGDAINMSFNATSLRYELVADGGYLAGHRGGMPIGNYSFNVSCFDSVSGFTNLTVVDAVSVSEYATSLAIENDTTKSVGEQVMFYANYTATGKDISGVGLNRSEIGRVVWNQSFVDNIAAVAYLDCENKGKKDCIVVGHDDNIFCYYPNGTQSFEATKLANQYVVELEVGDLDGDGYENEFVIIESYGIVRVYNETGDELWNSGDLGYFLHSMAIGDLDSDGSKDDFVVGVEIVNGESDRVVAFNKTNNTYWTNVWNGSDMADETHEVVFGDFDRDGFENDVASVYDSYPPQIFAGNGTLLFNITDFEDGFRSITAIDLDGDGFRDEIVFGDMGDLWAYEWNGTWGAELNNTGDEIWHTSAPNNYIYEIVAIDLDDDGYTDDVVVGDIDSIWGFDNDSNQLWEFTDVTTYLNSISIRDINGDGNDEIIAAGNNQVLWVLNKTGSLLWSYNIGLGNIGGAFGSSTATDISDINNDGIPDIAVASYDGYAHILQDVTCVANFNDSNSYNMTWNGTSNLWELNRTFSAEASYDWNVSCEKGGYVSQVDSSSIYVDDGAPRWSSNETNLTVTTDYGESVYFNVTLNDSTPDDYIFSWYNGTAWVNDSAVGFSDGEEVSVVKVVNIHTDSGQINWTWYVNDSYNGNLNQTDVWSVDVDNMNPRVGWAAGTPANGSWTPNASVEVNVSINETNLDEVKWNWNGTNYTLMNDSLVLMMNFDNVSALGESDTVVKDVSGHCYDNETEILTEDGWKYFKDLGDEEVATLNQKTGELEWELPTEKQVFNSSGEMYRIGTDEGDLVVSEKHRVYVGVEDDLQPLFINSVMVVEILEDDSVFFESENQNKTSNSDSFEITQVMPEIFEMFNSSDVRVYDLSNFLLDSNCEGFVFSSEFIENFFQAGNDVKLTLLSVPLGIWGKTHFMSSNLSNLSKVIWERGSPSSFFNFSMYSSFTSNSSIGSQLISSQKFWLSSDTVPVLMNSSNIFFLMTSSLPTSDQLTQRNSCNLCLNSGSNGTVMLTIYNSPLAFNLSNISSFFLNPSLNISGQFTPGCLSNFSLSSSGMENVVLMSFAIVNSSDCVDGRKCVDVFKSFDLQPIIDVYSDFNNGDKEIYFLDSNNEPVKVKSIVKEKYDGRIYDVDVGNDVVLVRRGGEEGLVVWSGNSNDGTGVFNGTGGMTASGKYGGGVYFDGVDDYVNAGDVSLAQTAITISSWVKFDTIPINGQAATTRKGIIVKYDAGANKREFMLELGITSAGSITDGSALQWNVQEAAASYSSDGILDSVTDFAANTWYHITVTFLSATKMEIYVNGVQDSNKTSLIATDFTNTDTPLLIGDGADDMNFNGTIDEVRIWNRSLSAEEISQMYMSNLNKYDTDKWLLYVNQSKNATTGLDDGDYSYFASAKDSAGNENLTEVRSVSVDMTYPRIDYTTGTEADGANKSQDWVFVNVSVTETNEESVVFNLFNSDSSLNVSQMFPSELPDDGAVNSVFNMTGNVLLMHMNNDSDYGENDTQVYDFSGHCYDNETRIMTRVEVECGLGDLGIGSLENDKEVILEKKKKERLQKRPTLPSLESISGNFNNYINVSGKEEKITKSVTSTVKQICQDYNECNINNYLNVSVEDDSVEDAPVALMVKHQPEKLGLPRHLGSIPGRGASTPEISDDKCYTLTDTSLKEVGARRTLTDTSLKEVGACYNYSWKYFKDLDETEEVATLNQESGELEWELPTEKQVFNSSGEMYRIETDEGDLVVSEKHRVYSSRNSLSSPVLNTGSSDCSLKCLSLDQIGMLSSSANAKNGTSFLSEINCDAFDLDSSEGDINSMILGRSDNLCSSSSLVISDLEQMVLEYLLSSLNNSLGENNSIEYEFINSLVYDSVLNKDRTTLVSTTNFIYGLLFSDDSSMLSFNLFPNSMQSSSVSLEFSNPSLNFSNASSCFILLANASLAIEDQLSHSNLSILCLNSFGTDNVSDGMFMSYTYDTCDMCGDRYQVFKDFGLERVTETYERFENGETGEGSSGRATVVPSSQFSERSGLSSQFSLENITETYERFENGEDIYFLDSNNEPVKVKSITKEEYKGKIYDVDVGNDVVLVERDGLVVWSGNSNNGTVTGASWTSSGKLGAGAFEFDGVNDYIEIPAHTNPTTAITVSVWLKSATSNWNDVAWAVSKRDAYVMHPTSGGKTLHWIVSNGTGDNGVLDWNSIGYAPDDITIWHHYVGTYDSLTNMSRLYVDGIERDSGDTQMGEINADTGVLWIGRDDFGTPRYGNGTIDEVAIWNRSLSATEIEEIYNWSRTRHRHNFTSLSDGTYYYNVTVNDSAGNENSTATYGITLDDTAPVISIVSPQNASSYYTAVIDFNVSVVENIFSTEGCWFSLDGAGNVSMTEFNASYFNYTKSDMTHGLHNVTFWCNDSLNNLGTASLLNFDVVLVDPTVSDVTVPSLVYSNATVIDINISNLGTPNVSNVNVSCYLGGVFFDSKLIALIEGSSYYVTNCTLDTTSQMNVLLNVTVDPANAIPESNESNNEWTAYIDILQLTGLDAYDQEDDSEDKAGWLSEQETLPGEMEYFFANWTMDNSSASVEGASCSITFSGGGESGTFNLSYNSSASLYYYNRTFDYAGNYSWTTSCSKTGYESLSGTGVERVRIPLFNQTSLGVTTGKVTVNYDENVNLSVNLSDSFDSSNSGYNLSEVWANVVMPNTTSLNYSLSGSVAGGMWNLTYSALGILGTYSIDYFANLTNGFGVVKLVESNFSVENTSILIDVGSEANTTNVVNVGGTIRRYNGSDYWDIANNLFTIKLNNVLVSSDSYASTNFSNGTGDGNVNMSVGNLRLNLTAEGDLVSYTDDYVTTGYTSDAESYNNVGWSSGHLFDINQMVGAVGNITYRFSAVTKFYNASAYMSTAGAEVGGGNDTIYYSFDNSTWTLLVNTTSTGLVGGTIPGVQGESEFYVRFSSDKTAGDNPVSSIEINYTNYNYSASGNYTSDVISLANVTYTILKWDESLNGGTTKIQLRESDDGSSWDAWGSNYTNYLDNDITSFSKDYLQYKVWLGATNLSRTPIIQGVNISYFNASTNSTGGYNYNVTIPTDSLGSLALEVEVVQNPTTGIVGLNSTLMDIWAETSTPYEVVRNYTSVSNYSVYTNWTRDDTGALINGTFNIMISNATMNSSQTCSGVSQCVASWLIPTNLSYGNYTVNISANNESAYYRNGSVGFSDYLEEKNTTGILYVVNKTIGDYSFGNKYPFYWNVTVNNTGRASMPDLYVYDYVGARGSAIDSVVEVTPCSKLYPNELCNATMLVTLKSVAEPGSYLISWRANWTDNDGSIAGGANYISYTEMYVIIVGNATMELSRYTENLTVQHNRSGNFSFYVNATGSDTVTNVDISFVEGNLTASDYTLPSAWVSVLSTNPIVSIPAGDDSLVSINVDVPIQTAPGNYSGTINVSAGSGGAESLNLIVIVPVNGSWYLTPSTNFTYNYSFSLNTAGVIGNFTLTNLGNINMTMNVSYSPSGTYDYSALGTALFQENYNVSGLITNPTQVNVTKGGNATITLYQKGDSSPRVDVGIIIEFYNASATPTTFVIDDAWTIEEQDPNITGVWFLLDGVNGSVAEQFKNLTIKFRATDDVALNISWAKINLSWSGGATQIDAEFMDISGQYVLNGADRIVQNYSGNYSPTTSGAYTVIATVLDVSGNSYTSGGYTFTSYGTTTATLVQNYSSKTVGNVDLNNAAAIYVNYTINNSGLVTAYSPTLSFVKNSTIEIDNYTFSDLSSGSVDSYVIRMNVSELTMAGVYNVTTTLTWTNPNTGIGTSSSAVFSITVEENSSIAHSPSTIVTGVNSGSANSSVLQINNTGNTVLSSMNLNCYTGTLCNGMTVSFNRSDFQISLNGSTTINVTLTAPTGLAAGNYVGTINVSAVGFSDTIDIQAAVPMSKTWSLSTTSINTTKGAEISGNLQTVTINNTGNVNMTWNLGTTNSSLFTPNSSSLMVPLNTAVPFMINYTAPSEEGSYVAKITVENLDGAASPTQLNVTINMSVTALIVDIISPTESSPLENVTVGQNISVLANATYGATNITNGSTWNVTVGSSSCSSLNSTYNSLTNQWNLSCVAPDISDGVAYNLTVELTQDSYGTKSDVEVSAISYLDLTYPIFNVTRNHVNLGANISLEVNVTDNVAVESVIGVLTYPNSTLMNLSFTLSGGLYINNSITSDLAGEYSVNYTANDSTGNENSTVDWFEVYDKYYWNVNLVNYASTGVSGVNVSLKRPNTTTVLVNNVTNASGNANLNVNKRFYDLDAVVSGDEVIVKNVNFSNSSVSNISFNLHRISGESVLESITLYKPFVGLASNSTGLSSNAVDLIFNYSGYGYRDNGLGLSVIKCSVWNYTDRSCSGSWSLVGDYSNRDLDSKTIPGNSTGFSSVAYFLADNMCGNGACETTYGETTTTCSADCVDSGGTTVVSGGGGGGGGGRGLSAEDLAKIEDIVKSFLSIGGVNLETTSIYKELFAGEIVTVRVKLRNTRDTDATISLKVIGEVQPLVFFESTIVNLGPNEAKELIMKIVAPKFAKIGEYIGNLIIVSRDEEGNIPVTIKILAPEGKLLDVKIQPLTTSVAPGGVLRLQTDLLNLGKTKRVDVQFDLQLIDLKSGEIVTRAEEAFFVETSVSTVKNLTIPDYVPVGKYMVKAVAYYSNAELDGAMQASSIAYVNVQYNFFFRKVFGIPVWTYMTILSLVGIAMGGYYFLRWKEFQKKRFKSKVELNKLPQASSHSGFVGMVAETGIRTFVDMNKLQMHTLIAGATGGGKTIAAQDIIEEALIKKKSVIVFDPTAQWTGFFRKCEDARMLKRYKYFGVKGKDAKAFNGTIQTIRDPYEIIDIKKYMDRPGEITIFNISHLTPKEMDVIVASTIEQIFRTEPEESQDLKTLIVYDEVHRLLPKFGGSGKGFVQLERGAREFRKWGVGLFLISQVLSDFIGEIKANIGTEIQMGTRYEGDLDRISMKYGDDVLKSVVKEPVGTGMVVNAEYNNGRPYFVSFRPILHSTKRLTNDELNKYEKYFVEIEDLEYQAVQLKILNVDTMDLELEIKLSKAKIKSGQFQMADMYLGSLRPKVEGQWKKLGKEPIHIVKMKLRKSDVVKGIELAKAERAKYIKKNPQESVSFDQEIVDIKKSVDAEKKKGKNTSALEIKVDGLKERLKPFKGKVLGKDSLGIKQELDALKKEVSDFAKQTRVNIGDKKV